MYIIVIEAMYDFYTYHCILKEKNSGEWRSYFPNVKNIQFSISSDHLKGKNINLVINWKKKVDKNIGGENKSYKILFSASNSSVNIKALDSILPGAWYSLMRRAG